jgi:hypothetical protein
MNEIDMVQAINGIDEKYISESENITNVSRKKSSYKIAIIAAALLIAVPICAFRINEFLHRDNVEHYIAGAELIEQQSPGAVLNYVMKNDDFRVTVDMLLSDGHNVMIIHTAEAISETGRGHFNRMHYWPYGCLSYADGSKGPVHRIEDLSIPYIFGSYGYENLNEIRGRDDIRKTSIIECDGIDLEKEIHVEFYMNDIHTFAVDYFYGKDPELSDVFIGLDQEITNYFDGIGFTASFAPNVTCNTLYSSDGRQIYMSSFELYADDPSLIPELSAVTFIKDTGERVTLKRSDGRMHLNKSDDRAYLIFGEFIDPDEYVGVEVNGVEYFK